MVAITLENFNGIAPKIAPKRLGDGMAQRAINVRLDSAELAPLLGHPLEGSSLSIGTESIFYYQNNWLAFNTVVDFVPTLLANDTNDRLYLTDEEYPKQRSGVSSYRLGIPQPSIGPTGVATTPGNEEDIDRETVSYVYTYVDAWGSEGPPSPASSFIDHTRDTDINLTLGGSPPTGNYNFGTGALKRIYRSNTGTQGGAIYQFVKEVPIATDNTVDDVPNANLQEMLPSATWIGPPDDDGGNYPDGPLQMLTELPNGVLAGFTGNQVCLSEPYLPNAWPLEYRFSSSDKIVGIAAIQQGLLVVTEGKPFLLVGGHPSSVARLPIESDQAGVSRHGIVDMGGYAIYPSPDGLCLAEGNNVRLITADLLNKETWAEYAPSTIKAFQHEGRYIAFYDTGSKQAGFIFDPRGGKDSFIEIDDYAIAGYRSLADDSLYLVGADGKIRTWEADSSSPHTYIWKSRPFILPKPTAMSVLKVEADEYPFMVRVWANGILIFEHELTEPLVRLPGGHRERIWEIEIEGSARITYVGVFDSMAEVT